MAALDDMRINVELQLSDLEAEIMHARWRAAATDVGRQALVPFERSNEARQKNLRATLKAILHERAVMQSDLNLAVRIGVPCGPETFDAARFMAGQQPQAVYCLETNPQGSWYAEGAAARAIFEMTEDVIFTYRGSWAAEGANTSWESAWRVVGTEGTLLWDGAEAMTAHRVTGETGFFRALTAVEVPQPQHPEDTLGHRSVLRRFLDAIAAGTAPETAGADNIRSLAMVFGAIHSAETGQRQPIAQRSLP